MSIAICRLGRVKGVPAGPTTRTAMKGADQVRASIAIGLIACFLSTGCRQLNEWLDKQIDEKVAAEKSGLEQRVQALEADDSSIKGQLKRLQSNVSLSQVKPYQKAALDPAGKAFERMDSQVGFFVVYIDSVRSVADECELVLQIGNPMSATVTDATLRVKWGRRFKALSAKEAKEFGPFVDLTRSNYQSANNANYYAEWDAWQKSLVTTEATIHGPLKSGVWNRAEVRLAPCKASDLGYLEVSLDSNTVGLAHAP